MLLVGMLSELLTRRTNAAMVKQPPVSFSQSALRLNLNTAAA